MDGTLASLGRFFITCMAFIAMLVVIGAVLFSLRSLVAFISPSKGGSSESPVLESAPASQPTASYGGGVML